VRQEVSFCPGWANSGGNYVSCRHIAAEDEGECTMTAVLELTAFNLARSHGQPWVFEGLDTCQLVCTYGAFAVVVTVYRLLINFTHVSYLRIKIRICGWRQPVTDAVGLKIVFFSLDFAR
jgi:hypothetical protein